MKAHARSLHAPVPPTRPAVFLFGILFYFPFSLPSSILPDHMSPCIFLFPPFFRPFVRPSVRSFLFPFLFFFSFFFLLLPCFAGPQCSNLALDVSRADFIVDPSEHYQAQMTNILQAYVLQHRHPGYVQGMSGIQQKIIKTIKNVKKTGKRVWA